MSVDPLADLRAEHQAQGFRTPRPATTGIAREVLPPSLPGQPGYYDRIPPPDGPAMGETDQQGVPLPGAPVSNPVINPVIPTVTMMPSLPRRVVVYCGRGEDFVVSVEESAEDEALYSKRYKLATLLPILEVVRALGVRILDRTGGELAASEAGNEISLRSGSRQAPAGPGVSDQGGEGEPSVWAPVHLYPDTEQSG